MRISVSLPYLCSVITKANQSDKPVANRIDAYEVAVKTVTKANQINRTKDNILTVKVYLRRN